MQLLDDDGESEQEEQEKLYSGAKVTVTQSILLILSYSIRHSLSQNAIEDLLHLLRAFLPVGASAKILQSYYKFQQHVPTAKDQPNEFIFYCSNISCRSIVGEGSTGSPNNDTAQVCSSCSTPYTISQLRKDGCFFLMLSIALQISSILSVHGHKLLGGRSSGLRANVTDVHNSNVYQSVIALRDQRNISITWNADGVPLFKSSLNEVWPIRCIINELPPTLSQKNVILAGLSFGRGKPDMSSFMKCFVQSIEKMNAEGVHWTNPQTAESIVSFVYPLFSSCDSVARCAIQCIHQYNGSYGCSWCLQEGVRVVKGAGHTNVYPGLHEELRTHQGLLDCGREVTNDVALTHVKGVKSVSPLFLLKKYGFDMARGFPVDYMHCVLLGIERQFIELWTDSKYHESKWHMTAADINAIDKALLAIKPPCDIKRFPRSIKLAGKWKANELRSFLLFYSAYVLQNVLNRAYFKHWLLLVHAMYYLLQEDISDQELALCERLLDKFVMETHTLYGIEQMSYNVHQLTHLVQCVRDCGPLWRTSSFPFESNNQQVLKLFAGKTYVPQQIASNFVKLVLVKGIAKAASCNSDPIANEIVQTCMNSWLHGYPMAKSALFVSDSTTAIGNCAQTELSYNQLRLVRSIDPHFSEKCLVYQRVLIRGRSYCTELYGKNLKTHSYSVLLRDKRLVRIKSFAFDPCTSEMYIFCQLYRKSPYASLPSCGIQVSSHLYVVSLTETIVAIKPCDIVSKIVVLGKCKSNGNSVDNSFVIAQQPNTVECD